MIGARPGQRQSLKPKASFSSNLNVLAVVSTELENCDSVWETELELLDEICPLSFSTNILASCNATEAFLL